MTASASVGDLTTLRVLVPVDGSPLSASIVPHVRRLVRDDDQRAEVHLLTVLDGEPPTERERNEQADEASVHLAMLRDALEASSVRVVSRVVRGEPLAQILEAARGIRADLVAMSTHGRGGVSRWVRGSVAERVLWSCGVPVFMVNPHTRPPQDIQPYRRVIIPLDGTPGSAEVLAVAGALALASKAQAVLLHVTPELPHALTPDAHAAGLLGSARRALQAAGVTDVRVVGRIGEPSATILNEVEVEHGDVLALSTHARTGLVRWRFGSVAEPVLRKATCPVLAYRMRAT